MTARNARPAAQPLSDALRQAVASCGLTLGAVARLSGADASVLSRFMRGEGASLETADKIAVALEISVSAPDRELATGDGRAPISAALRRAIATSGLSQAAVARLAGIHSSVVNRFARGMVSLELSTVDRVVAALGLSVGQAAPAWLGEVAREAARQDRSVSWILQISWKTARRQLLDGWRLDLLDLACGRADGPVHVPSSVLRSWLKASGSDAEVSGVGWVAERDPQSPGVAKCNGVGSLGGGFSMRWDDLRRIAEEGPVAAGEHLLAELKVKS